MIAGQNIIVSRYLFANLLQAGLIDTLCDAPVHTNIEALSIEDYFNNLLDTETVGGKWTTLHDAMISSSKEVLGFQKRKNQDWFNEHQEEIGQFNQKQEPRPAFKNIPSVEKKEIGRQRKTAKDNAVQSKTHSGK